MNCKRDLELSPGSGELPKVLVRSFQHQCWGHKIGDRRASSKAAAITRMREVRSGSINEKKIYTSDMLGRSW